MLGQGFDPFFKIHIDTNFVPPIDGGDKGVMDRFCPIPWKARYTTDPQHETEFLKDPIKANRFKALSNEFGTWALQGAHRFYAIGTGSVPRPPVLVDLANEIRCSLDMVSVFLDQCALGEQYRWQVDDCFAAFCAFAARRHSDDAHITFDAFKKAMLEHTASHGITTCNDEIGTMYFKGCQLRVAQKPPTVVGNTELCTMCNRLSTDVSDAGLCLDCTSAALDDLEAAESVESLDGSQADVLTECPWCSFDLEPSTGKCSNKCGWNPRNVHCKKCSNNHPVDAACS